MQISNLKATLSSYLHPGSRRFQLSDIYLDVSSGRIACIFGISGSGKSTLLKALLGLAPGIVDGDVAYHHHGNPMSAVEARKLGHVGVLFDNTAMVPWLRVRENILLPSCLNDRLKPPDREAQLSLLNAVALEEDVLDAFPHRLSFGMRQRVAVARALCYCPTFLLLDELFAGLDIATIETIQSTLLTYVRKHQAICIMASHDIGGALGIADDVYFLRSSGQMELLAPQASMEPVVRQIFAEEFSNSRAQGIASKRKPI